MNPINQPSESSRQNVIRLLKLIDLMDSFAACFLPKIKTKTEEIRCLKMVNNNQSLAMFSKSRCLHTTIAVIQPFFLVISGELQLIGTIISITYSTDTDFLTFILMFTC